MNVTVKTPFAQIDLEMSEPSAKELVRIAFGLAAQDNTPIYPSFPIQELSSKPCETEPVEPEPEPAPSPVKAMSRNDRLFGKRETWNTPKQTYTGFLYIECENCGKRKGFCAKQPIDSYICECGNHTPLQNLVLMLVRCKCGASYKYMTNVKDDLFTVACLSCGNPVDMERNLKNNTVITVGSRG